MNLILVSNNDFIDEQIVSIRDARRLAHIREIHKAVPGEIFKAGLLNGKIGTGKIITHTDDEIRLELSLIKPPPAKLPVTLVLALPRPKMLKRTLQTLATLGVENIYLVNSYRVEKSYWQTPLLEPDAIHEQLLLGLEQGCDTVMPKVTLIKRLKPFVQDELSGIIANTKAFVAHPYTDAPCPSQINYPITLAIGPEGGFIPYEIDLFNQCGFTAVNLGERIMRVETVVPYLLGRLF